MAVMLTATRRWFASRVLLLMVAAGLAADADAWLAQTTALSADAKAKIIEKSKTATQVYRSEFD